MCPVLYEAKRHRSCYQGTDNLKSKMDRGKAEVLGKHRREEETRAERGGSKGREELEGLANHRKEGNAIPSRGSSTCEVWQYNSMCTLEKIQAISILGKRM